MNMRIIPTPTRVCCGGEHSGCTTYEDHDDWEDLLKQSFHIPAEENALLVRHTHEGINFFLCWKHAVKFLNSIEHVKDSADQLGWNDA